VAVRVQGDTVHLGATVSADQAPDLIDALVAVSPFRVGGAGDEGGADGTPAERDGGRRDAAAPASSSSGVPRAPPPRPQPTASASANIFGHRQ
jgi:hypothetical protein